MPSTRAVIKLVAVSPHGNVAGSHRNRVERSRILLGPGPQQRSAITQIARPGSDRPNQHAKARKSGAAQRKKSVIWNQRGGLRILRPRHGIGSQQLQKRVVVVIAFAFMEGRQPLLELRICRFGLTHRTCPRQADKRKRNAERRGCGERSAECQTCSCDAM